VRHPELTSSEGQAISLLTDAAEAGSWKASATLALLARDGKGMPADKRLAYYHFLVAKLQSGQASGNLLANDLRILSNELGAEQARTVNLDADAWFQKHQTPLQFVYKDGETWQQFPLFAIEYPEGDDHAGRIVARPPS